MGQGRTPKTTSLEAIPSRAVLASAWRRVTLLTPLLLLGLSLSWAWTSRSLVVESLRLPVESILWCGVAALLLHLLVSPLRHRLLVGRYRRGISWAAVLADRLTLLTYKTFLSPLGEPVCWPRTRIGRGLSPDRIASLWTTDKLATLIAQGSLLLGLLVATLSTPLLGASVGALPLIAGWLLAFALGKQRPTERWPAGGSLRALAHAATAQLGGLGAYHPGALAGLLLTSLLVEGIFVLALLLALEPVLATLGQRVGLTDLALVFVASNLPLPLGGTGSREAATLLVFHGRADSRLLFLAAFAHTLFLRVGPALLGLLLDGLRGPRGGPQR
jgi:hypothetical protein